MISEARKQWVFTWEVHWPNWKQQKGAQMGKVCLRLWNPERFHKKKCCHPWFVGSCFPASWSTAETSPATQSDPISENRVLPSCITALQMRSNELSKISVFQHLPDFTSKIHQNLTLSCKHFASSTLSHLPYSKAHIELLRGILSGEGQDSQFAPRVFAQETGHIQHLSIHLRGRMPVGIVGTLPQRTPKSSTFPGWIFW